jgi:hypothetical protein
VSSDRIPKSRGSGQNDDAAADAIRQHAADNGADENADESR